MAAAGYSAVERDEASAVDAAARRPELRESLAKPAAAVASLLLLGVVGFASNSDSYASMWLRWHSRHEPTTQVRSAPTAPACARNVPRGNPVSTGP